VAAHAGGSGVWAGFFNASFWPSLVFRTCVASTLAALAACVLINTMELSREQKAGLIGRASRFAAPMAVDAGPRAVVLRGDSPRTAARWLLGGSMPMMMFVGVAAGASTLIGGYVIIGLIARRL